MTDLPIRLAAAPISWGVCEVPGWGYQLSPERVFGEMRELGITATETGPEGFLPTDPAALRAALAPYGLQVVGGFVPLVLHDPETDPVPGFLDRAEQILAAGGEVAVLAAATGTVGYDTRPELAETGWTTLLSNLDRVAAAAGERGLRAALHPHVGTVIERRDEVLRVIDGSTVPLCLDTGHLLVGGTDPAEVVSLAAERVALVHLKDVRAELAARVRFGELSYTDAVSAGMYTPLGDGDVDFAAIVGGLSGAGYDGWYVLEQDTILGSESDGDGAKRDVAASIEHLRVLCGISA
jgi:inosose dehydratase